MKHKKTEHPQNISICKKYESGYCSFTKENCWYKHENKENENVENNPEMIVRIFDMMERFAERFEMIENQL